VVRAAHELILRDGVAGMSLRRVASSLDYSPGALYGYFDSKDALLDAVRAACFSRLNDEILTAIAGVTGAPAQLRECARVYLAFAEANPIDYELMFGMGPSAATRDEPVAQRGLRLILQQGLERGELVLPVAGASRRWCCSAGRRCTGWRRCGSACCGTRAR
jgi:AcrR family transcriptional regulator